MLLEVALDQTADQSVMVLVFKLKAGVGKVSKALFEVIKCHLLLGVGLE